MALLQAVQATDWASALFFVVVVAIGQLVMMNLLLGVLIDAFLIRMTLTPALMSLLGQHAWWLPHTLDRLIPNVDIEGTNLQQDTHPDADPAHEARELVPA